MFGPAAIARQKVDGSYTAYGSQTERPDDGPMSLDTREKAMIRAVDQFQIATVAETGWPYIQYRSGPKGFLQVLDDRTLGFADFAGNHQYVTAANLDHDDRVAVFLVNYPLRQRLKLYGRARTVEAADDPQLLDRLRKIGDLTVAATCERSVVIDVEAFDWNCTRSIIPATTRHTSRTCPRCTSAKLQSGNRNCYSGFRSSKINSRSLRRIEATQKLRLEFGETSLLDRGSNVVHQFDREALVVDGAQRRREHFLGLEQVMDVGLGVVRAGVAVAVLVDRGEVASMLGGVDVETARRHVDRCIACHA